MALMQALREKMAQWTREAGGPGMRRFLVHAAGLLACLEKARTSKNQALALYQTNARQCLFYLQALCRAYKKTGTKKRFKDIGGSVKILEDQLGKIDYWDGWVTECSACKGFPLAMLRTLRDHRERELEVMQRMLDEGCWLADKDSALEKILDSLAEEDWQKAGKDREKIARFLVEEISELDAACHTGVFDFQELETGVHEFRRQLRWIGIYAFAFDGLIQLRMVEKPESLYYKYMTEVVVKSPFHSLPPEKTGIAPLHFSAPDYFALSWIIAEIGKIKDVGQKIEALREVARESNCEGHRNLEDCFARIIPDADRTLAEIPNDMTVLIETFVMRDRILQRLAASLTTC